MNLPEARDIIEAACNHEERFDEEQLWDAQKLSIEVMDYVIACRVAEPGSVPDRFNLETA